MKISVFWVIAKCSLVDVYRRFRAACCPDDGGSHIQFWSCFDFFATLILNKMKVSEQTTVFPVLRKNTS
jgi:hypothetical protein